MIYFKYNTTLKDYVYVYIKYVIKQLTNLKFIIFSYENILGTYLYKVNFYVYLIICTVIWIIVQRNT